MHLQAPHVHSGPTASMGAKSPQHWWPCSRGSVAVVTLGCSVKAGTLSLLPYSQTRGSQRDLLHSCHPHRHPQSRQGDTGIILWLCRSPNKQGNVPPGRAPWTPPNGDTCVSAAVSAILVHEWTSRALTAARTHTNTPLCPLSHLPPLLLGPDAQKTMALSKSMFTAGKARGEAETRVGSPRASGEQWLGKEGTRADRSWGHVGWAGRGREEKVDRPEGEKRAWEEDGGVGILLTCGVGLEDGNGLVAVCHEWHWHGILLLVEPSCCSKNLLTTGNSAAHPTVPGSGVLVKPHLFCTGRTALWLQEGR